VVGDIAKVVITIIATVLGAIKPLINTFIDGVNLVIKGLNIIPGVNITPLRKIGDSSSASTGLSAGLYGSTPALGSASQIANAQAAVAGATSGLSSAWEPVEQVGLLKLLKFQLLNS
jgi:hypothetical protein